MTPTATTPAARRRVKASGATKKSASAKSTSASTPRPAAPGHRRTARPAPAPRRVSGPIGGRTAAAGAARRTAPKRGHARTSIGARAAAFVRAMPDHALLDRLIRGRAWIPVLGVMLAGIVAMQVEVLKLGATMGRAIEQGTALQSRNELLRDSVASLEDEQRIVRLASGLGMVMPAPGGVGFLRARASNVNRAAANIKAPDPAEFAAMLSSNGAITQPPVPPGASTSTSTITSTPSTPATGTVAPTVSTPSAPTTPATPATPSSGTTSSGTTSSGTPSNGITSSGTPSSTTLGAGTGAASAAATGGGASVTGQ